jgi:hypothetical protein
VTITFDVAENGRALRVTDTAEREQFDLRADRAIDPVPADTDEFTFPVDEAVTIEAGELHFPVYRQASVFEDGEAVARATESADSEWLPRSTYEVDMSPPGAKTYVHVFDARVRPRFSDTHVWLDVDPAARLAVGVRSHHESPAATVTATEDPRDVMAAVSTFGSALKTLSPDRSWPTLRGHPPAIRVGQRLDVPDAVAPPETDVAIEVPPEYGAVFAVAPLAYYLGATVEPGTDPGVVAAGERWAFDTDALADSVRECLQHVFALDGAVRTVGVFPFEHAQAETLAERVDLDYERLFDLSLAERTAAYFDVPRAATADLVDWHLTADVQPQPRYAPTLSHLAYELALVRSPPPAPTPAERAPEPDALARTTNRTRSDTVSLLDPADCQAPGHVWVGDGFAVDAATPTVGSFRRGLDWPQGEDPLDVHVVYNDARLEAAETTAYAAHPVSSTDVTVSRSLTTSELHDVLTSDTDFLHFVGHVTERGMVCPDGDLDVRTVPDTGIGAFFLNGCRSYEQGFALLTAGAAGGIVTVDDVEDELAGAVGRDAAVLLDAGYPLYAVLDALDRAGHDASRYTVLGHPTLALRRPTSSAPLLHVLAPSTDSDGDLPVTTRGYPRGESGLGGICAVNHFDGPSRLFSAATTAERIPNGGLDEAFELESPAIVDDTLVSLAALSPARFE